MPERFRDPDPPDPDDPDGGDGDDTEELDGSQFRGVHIAPAGVSTADPLFSPAEPERAPLARSSFLPLPDERVAQLAVLGSDGRRLVLIRPPFPEPIEHWVAATYGAGKYRIIQRDYNAKHIGSKTLKVLSDPGKAPPAPRAFTPEPPRANGNGHGHAEASAFSQVAAAAAAVPPGTDWKAAAVITGLPLLAGVLTAGFEALSKRPDPPKSELSQLVEVAKLLSVPNEERAKLFQEGMKLYSSIASELPRGERGDGEGLNIRDILSGIGEMVKAFRGSQPPGNAAPAAAPAESRPSTPATAQLTAGSETVEQTGERYVEQLLVTEIRRAVGRGEGPECFVVLVDAYLPPLVVTWLEKAPEEQVLAELPARFPNHSEYLRDEQVQAFLRSALTMLREDAEEETSGVPPAGDPAATE